MSEICKACSLSSRSTNCKRGFGNSAAPLLIYITSPGYKKAEDLIVWMILKMGLSEKDVYIDYILRCPAPSGSKTKTSSKKTRLPIIETCTKLWPTFGRGQEVVTLGNIPYEAFSDRSKVSGYEGRYDKDNEVWCGYGLDYCLQNPAEALRVWRLIYKAAEKAGLQPKHTDITLFEFPEKMRL